jgi:L-seryl-tRNA(Ser) seleniumtransferase
LIEHHPVLKFMLRTESELDQQAEELRSKLMDVIGDRGEVDIEQGLSEVGGGSLAAESLPTRMVLFMLNECTPEGLARKLRLSDPPIIPRILNNKIALDMRTIRQDEIDFIVKAVSIIANEGCAA